MYIRTYLQRSKAGLIAHDGIYIQACKIETWFLWWYLLAHRLQDLCNVEQHGFDRFVLADHAKGVGCKRQQGTPAGRAAG